MKNSVNSPFLGQKKPIDIASSQKAWFNGKWVPLSSRDLDFHSASSSCEDINTCDKLHQVIVFVVELQQITYPLVIIMEWISIINRNYSYRTPTQATITGKVPQIYHAFAYLHGLNPPQKKMSNVMTPAIDRAENFQGCFQKPSSFRVKFLSQSMRLLERHVTAILFLGPRRCSFAPAPGGWIGGLSKQWNP